MDPVCQTTFDPKVLHAKRLTEISYIFSAAAVNSAKDGSRN
ncbi:MAG: hypothetical protein N4A40_14540 [Tissierellales bacterium]|nr:hypothetical protein [Tissierellales bacterium]